MRYKLRSSTTKNSALKHQPDDSAAAPAALTNSSANEDAAAAGSSSSSSVATRAKVRRKTLHKHEAPYKRKRSPSPCAPSSTAITALPEELVLLIGTFLDARALLNLMQTCKWFHAMLVDSDSFWKLICTREELANYACLDVTEPAAGAQSVVASSSSAHPTPLRCGQKVFVQSAEKVGWSGRPMHVHPPDGYSHWRKIFLRGLQMRRNIWQSNFEGWRIYANTDMPIARLTPGLDLNEVKKSMGDFPKLSVNDDLKIDWDEKFLVVFHFFRGEGERCEIRLWDIEDEPKFLYGVDKGIECITDEVSVTNEHVVIVPSWPLEAGAIVMTLDLKNQMNEVGKYLFSSPERQQAIDDNWEHTQLRVVKNRAMVVCRCPDWTVIIVDLPSCELCTEIPLNEISEDFDCQQIRSYKNTAMILFAKKHNDSSNHLVTIDITTTETKLRSCYPCADVSDVALFTEPEEIYLMKRDGDVVLYDANAKTETVKIANPNKSAAANGASLTEYQLFVNRKEQICVMQSASEVAQGRYIKVYTYGAQQLYSINLDLCKYGLSRDESICIYTNGAFLAAADSKKFALFNVKTGDHLGAIHIPSHLERAKGKDEKDCMFEQTGLSLFIFDEDKLIAVHDYERSFPAVLDIYKFW